jgi:hypothetical protein
MIAFVRTNCPLLHQDTQAIAVVSTNHAATVRISIIACCWAERSDYAVGSTVVLSDVLGQVGPRIDVSSFNFNFSLDPQFCGIPGSGNYFLKSTSPCLPENNPFIPTSGWVGPLPAGCGAVSVQATTWGAVKALYRSP